MSLVDAIEKKFRSHANKEIAAQQTEYMRFMFPYFGIKAPVRQSLQKPFFAKDKLPPKAEMASIVKTAWKKPEREFQYFALEFALKYVRQFEKKDIALFEYMITTKSWWDTVDMTASKAVGGYMAKFPEERVPYVNKWLNSDNMWLKRTAILFQLKYKQQTDTALLEKAIRSNLGSSEFFINKAIGWALREYGKTNPDWVLAFVKKTTLDPLSHSEALKRLQ